MTSECEFNSKVPQYTFQKKQLAAKFEPDVRSSQTPVTMVTAPCEVQPYAFAIVEIVPRTGSRPW